MTKYSSGHSKFKTPITAPLRTLAVLPPIPLAASSNFYYTLQHMGLFF